MNDKLGTVEIVEMRKDTQVYTTGAELTNGAKVTELVYSPDNAWVDVLFDNGTHIRVLNPDYIVLNLGESFKKGAETTEAVVENDLDNTCIYCGFTWHGDAKKHVDDTIGEYYTFECPGCQKDNYNLTKMLEIAAVAIVNYTNVVNGASVQSRQATNDECYDFAEAQIKEVIDEYAKIPKKTSRD